MARQLVVCVVVLACVSSARAQVSYPMLMDAHPLAVQVGTSAEVEVTARYNLYGGYRVLVSGSGVTAEPAAAPEAKQRDDKKPEEKPSDKKDDKAAAPAKRPESPKLKVKFTVAPDALPGVREFRIATPQGVSTVGQVVVVRDPVVVEKNPNDTLAQATPVTLPATLCGAIEKNEDVDHFKFHAAAGQALTFHVRSARCEDKIHDLQTHADPIIALKNSAGSVLAINDNYFFADPLLHYRFPAEGDYFLEVRDVRYQGNTFWQYAVEVHDRPFVTNVFPLGVAPEQPTTLELVGFNLPARPSATLTVSGQEPEGLRWLELVLSPPANPVPVVVSKLPLLLEAGDNHARQRAQQIPIPAGISGRISGAGESDFYAFDARKGDRFTFEVVARRHQSALDPVLAVVNDKGARLVEQDDMSDGRISTADALIENWSAPADGRYTLEVRDLHLEGGPQHVYFLKAQRAEPYFTLQLDSDKTNLAPGVGGVIFARVYRKNGFTGEVQLAVEGLPPGVEAHCGRILADGNDGCIVLAARPEAHIGVSDVRITGRALPAGEGSAAELVSGSQPMQETYLPGGGRGVYPVESHTVAVNAPLDILAVKLSSTEITLRPGESQKIDVTIQRAEGFDKNVTLDVMYRHLGGISGNSLPAGITLDDKASKTLLTGKVSQGVIVLKAAPDARPVEKQIVPVIANVAINFVMKMSYVGEPLQVTIAEKK